jgi:membrane protease YdiL (CAAX protease family)
MKRAVAYVLLAFALSWVWWLPMALAGVTVGPGQAWPTHLVGLLGPAVAAIAVTAAYDGRAGLVDLARRVLRWRLRCYWWVLLGVTAAAASLPLITNPTATATDYLDYSGAGQFGFLTVLYVLLLNGFGEEIGWRGFLADYLLARHSLGVTALVVGGIWAVWHLPLFWVVDTFRDLGVGGTVGWVFGLLGGSIVLAWLYSGSGRSILLAALWHTAFNFTTATTAAAGVTAAVVSTLVMVGAVVIACLPSTWRRPAPAT